MSNGDSLPQPMWTKFICTIGKTGGDPETLEGLVRAGANIIRNNFAHANYDEYRARKATLEDINRRLGTNVKMQVDLQGTNIRVGDMGDGVEIAAGGEYTFYTNVGEKPSEDALLINDDHLHNDVKVGEPITFMDGALEGEVTSVEGHVIRVKMKNGGLLKSRKSVNVPETKMTGPAITEKDRADLEFLLETGVDYIALSFVGSRHEIDEVRKMIGDRPIKLISKVERREAIKNILEIIDASDAVMIARGDLGIELPMEEIPILQREITALCEHAGKPVITATQMMLSLSKNLRPTRAEVSDVANAVFARSDALMLSEETADGIDPVNAITTMRKIAARVEDYLYNRPNFFEEL